MMPLITTLAPAKVNLFLNVTGKREDGYHLYQSMIMFADRGDEITLQNHNGFDLIIEGEFSNGLGVSDNLVTKAVHALCQIIDKKPDIKITLKKNIPQGAGLAGGSSDAASVIKALIEFWNVSIDQRTLKTLLKNLGTDVPACFYAQSCLAEGIGAEINPCPAPALYAVLIYPQIICNTSSVFKNYDKKFSETKILPKKFDDHETFITFIKNQKNDLEKSACDLFPEIRECLTLINQQENILLTRMSGSGSCCFGIFNNKEDVAKAVQKTEQEQPKWWVKAVRLS